VSGSKEERPARAKAPADQHERDARAYIARKNKAPWTRLSPGRSLNNLSPEKLFSRQSWR